MLMALEMLVEQLKTIPDWRRSGRKVQTFIQDQLTITNIIKRAGKKASPKNISFYTSSAKI
jgi:hypothetical protein